MATTNERITNGVYGMLPQYNMKSIERINERINELMDACDFMGIFGTCTPSREQVLTSPYSHEILSTSADDVLFDEYTVTISPDGLVSMELKVKEDKENEPPKTENMPDVLQPVQAPEMYPPMS